jgi:hypothetical protein
MSVFGHRHLSIFFRPLVEITANGFTYKGRGYSWNDVRTVEVSDSPLRILAGYPAAIPRATITLTDGTKIRLNGRVLEKEGRKPKVGFSSSRSDAFDELIGLFKAHAA